MNSASVAPVARPKVPVIAVAYSGKAGEVLKLHIVNLLMNIITLGIYSFWGKTRIRRYMTSQLSIARDRFEYTGTGKELLFGWLKAMLIFMPIIVGMQIPGVNLIVLPLFFAVLSVAVFLAMRYRLSRTRWRGIRFSLGGMVKEYLVLSVKRTLINIFTLGWKIPQSDIMKWSYMANHMVYGDMKFSYQGDYKKLQKTHLKTLAFVILILAIALPLIGVVFGSSLLASPDDKTPSEFAIVMSVLAFYVCLATSVLARLWYHAALWHEKFRGLRLGTLRFKMDVTGGGLAKLHIVNMLLIICTLGIARPIAAHRTLRYYATHLRIGGDINELIVAQSQVASGTGTGDALAADVGFDLGM